MIAGVTAAVAFLLVDAAMPSFCSRCGMRANDSAAIATLKNIQSAEAQFRDGKSCDVDGDGVGENGYLAELAGAVPVRQADGDDPAPLTTPVLSKAFGIVRNGRVQRGGFVFQLHLPGPGGVWVPESSTGGGRAAIVATDAAEQRWLCYAWPIEHGVSGHRAYAITEHGDVLASNMHAEAYSGDLAPPAGAAAFVVDGGRLVPAANTTDVHGNVWVVVQ